MSAPSDRDRFRPATTLALVGLAIALVAAGGWLRYRYAPSKRATEPRRTLPDAERSRRELTNAVARAARRRRPAPPRREPRARVPPPVQALQLRLAALKDEAADRGAACLQKLDRADGLDADKTARWQYLRGLCELRQGQCAEGRKRLLAVLPGRTPTEPPAAIAAKVEALVNSRCPVTVGTPAERVRRLLQALPRQRLLGNLELCRAQGQALTALWQKLGPTQRAPLATAYHNATIDAAKCSGWSAHCDEAWALWLAAYRRRFRASLPKAHIERMARAAFPRIIKGCSPPERPTPRRAPPRPR